jgi:hypothetical protein
MMHSFPEKPSGGKPKTDPIEPFYRGGTKAK